MVRQARPDARVIFQDGKGKGNALSCGFGAATGDIIVMLDADGSTDPAEIPRFIAALRTGADYAKGTRFVTGGGSADISRTRRIGNRALNVIVNRLWGAKYSDLCYGYNAFWQRHLPRLQIDSSGFEVETLLNIKAHRAKLAIIEVPSFEGHRLFRGFLTFQPFRTECGCSGRSSRSGYDPADRRWVRLAAASQEPGRQAPAGCRPPYGPPDFRSTCYGG